MNLKTLAIAALTIATIGFQAHIAQANSYTFRISVYIPPVVTSESLNSADTYNSALRNEVLSNRNQDVNLELAMINNEEVWLETIVTR